MLELGVVAICAAGNSERVGLATGQERRVLRPSQGATLDGLVSPPRVIAYNAKRALLRRIWL